MKPSTKAWLLLLGLSLFIVVGAQQWGQRLGLLWGVGITLGINTLVYFYGELRLRALFPGQRLEGNDPWGLIDTAKRLCSQIRVPVPRIIVLSTTTPQALAMGRNWNNATIFVSRGLLETFSHEEIKAVLAYEIATIKNLDSLAYVVAGAFTDILLQISGMLDAVIRTILGAPKTLNSWDSHFFTSLVAPVGGLIVKLTVGSQHYFERDAMAGALVAPQTVAQVLWKLHSYSVTTGPVIPPSVAHMFMANPLTEQGAGRYFQLQPSVERRITQLVGYYPL